MTSAPPRLNGDSLAFFLDVDGTLLEIADAPQLVRVQPGLLRLLESLSRAAGGAVALVSGRSIADLDRLFAPLELPAAGLHGAERRDAAGGMRVEPREPALARVATRLAAWSAAHAGTVLEDKGGAVALHYRMAPASEAGARRVVAAALQELGSGYVLQEGKCVLELKPAGADKAHAIERFMQESPFAGRRPVFVGDDVTDEDGFRKVRELGGVAVAVGERPDTAAAFRLSDVAAVRGWLEAWLREREGVRA